MNKLAENPEHMDRVLLCAEMLAQGFYKGQVKKHMRAKYGLSTPQINKYISRARKHLHAQAQADRDEMRGASLAFYRRIARNKNLEMKDRLKAQERVDKILGLEAPTQVNQFVSGKQETKVTVKYVNEEWRNPRLTDADAN